MADRITRGGWLTAYLIFGLLVSALALSTDVLKWEHMTKLMPAWAVASSAVISFLRFFSLLAVWFWSRAGVVANIVLSLIALPVTAFSGNSISGPVETILLGIVGILILVLLVRSRWPYMSWGITREPVLPS